VIYGRSMSEPFSGWIARHPVRFGVMELVLSALIAATLGAGVGLWLSAVAYRRDHKRRIDDRDFEAFRRAIRKNRDRKTDQ
jgi:hypothetical protein